MDIVSVVMDHVGEPPALERGVCPYCLQTIHPKTEDGHGAECLYAPAQRQALAELARALAAWRAAVRYKRTVFEATKELHLVEYELPPDDPKVRLRDNAREQLRTAVRRLERVLQDTDDDL